MAHSDYIQYGGDLMVFVNDQPIAFSTSAKLSVSVNTRELTSKDSANWTEKKTGRYTWNASTDALYNMSTTGTTQSVNDLYAIFTGGTSTTIKFASKSGTSPSWTAGTSVKYFSGTAYITAFDFNASDGETASYSVTFDGTGELTLV